MVTSVMDVFRLIFVLFVSRLVTGYVLRGMSGKRVGERPSSTTALSESLRLHFRPRPAFERTRPLYSTGGDGRRPMAVLVHVTPL